MSLLQFWASISHSALTTMQAELCLQVTEAQLVTSWFQMNTRKKNQVMTAGGGNTWKEVITF